MKKIMLSATFMLLFISNIFADSIKLKSGQEVEGKIIERTHNSVKIDFNGVELTYFLDEVEKINNESILPEAQNTSMPVKVVASEPAQSVDSLTQPSSFNQYDTEASAQSSKTAQMGSGKLIEKESRQALLSEFGPLKKASIGLAGILIVLIIVFVFYVYFAICLQFLAVKTAQGPVWLAWVPIANFFLMCKIGGVPYVYLFILLGSFIPVIGIFVSLGFSTFIWYKIALARNKPGWIGALTCLPIAGFIIVGYLAFSD